MRRVPAAEAAPSGEERGCPAGTAARTCGAQLQTRAIAEPWPRAVVVKQRLIGAAQAVPVSVHTAASNRSALTPSCLQPFLAVKWYMICSLNYLPALLNS